MAQSGSNAKWVLLSLVCLMAAALFAASQPAQESSRSRDNVKQLGKSDSSDGEPSIFDFTNYIQLFKKVYKGNLELMARAYYFSARAIRVFVSAVKYRHGEQLYYLAINRLSDASPKELDKMRNKVMEREASSRTDSRLKETPADSVKLADPGAGIEADLRQLAQDNQDEPAFRELGEFLDKTSEPKRRKKRAVSGKRLRHLPKEKLINTGSNFKLDPEVEAKITRRVASNNPAYKPIELSSNGLIDEQEEVIPYHREEPVFGLVRIRGILYRLDDLFTNDGKWKRDKSGAEISAHYYGDYKECENCEDDVFYDDSVDLISDDEGDDDDDDEDDSDDEGEISSDEDDDKMSIDDDDEDDDKMSIDDDDDDEEFYDTEEQFLPDEVFLDLRETTKCFFPPRYQGYCGSCYAFATTTIAEWHYCMQTGRLVEFSEQYMIDCGNAYVDGLDGCEGGKRLASANFFHNFGLELRSHYPYLAVNGTCPYYEDEPLNTTGYIRTNMPTMFEVSLKEMPHLLRFRPIFVQIKTDASFHEYGGGVHAIPCPGDPSHEAVLVGHGRENGREYWLIRNSHGVGWGEDGHYKLDKSANGICNQMGYAFATDVGFSSKMDAHVNPDYPAERVRKLKLGSK